MHQSIPVVDVFAGPGGLSEGFSSFVDDTDMGHPFQVALSAEKDEHAIRTLRLRAFFRWFVYINRELGVPKVYVDYVTARNNKDKKHDAIFLSIMLCEEESLEDVLGKHPSKWESFKNTYQQELSNILEAVRFARLDAMHIELGKTEVDLEVEIRERLKSGFGKSNQPFVLIGGPPCQAYSHAGRSRRKGNVTAHLNEKTGEYEQDKDPRSWLYKEYLKILEHSKPAIFIMENVRGMLTAELTDKSGKKEKAWKMIVKDLHAPVLALEERDSCELKDRYVVCSLENSDYFYDGSEESLERLEKNSKLLLINTAEHGVPQRRERVILLGVRMDLLEGLDCESVLKELVFLDASGVDCNSTVHQAIGDLPPHYSRLSSKFVGDGARPKKIPKKDSVSRKQWKELVLEYLEVLVNGVAEAKKEGRDNDLFQQNVACERYAQIEKILLDVDEDIFNNPTCEEVKHPWKIHGVAKDNRALANWYSSHWVGHGILNHEARRHMDTDILRYLYSSAYAFVSAQVNAQYDRPVLRDQVNLKEFQNTAPSLLVPDHKNQESFVDRFKVQRAEKPSSTVTSHISKDGHHFIHPDPYQSRSLTVREAARLQTFPDSYFFEGEPTHQYVQVGNAVPPLLANKIAAVVSRLWSRLVI